jgi:preprotein translocase subunit SecF
LAWRLFQLAIIGVVMLWPLTDEPPDGISKEKQIALALLFGVVLAFVATIIVTAWIEIYGSIRRKLLRPHKGLNESRAPRISRDA